MEAYAHWCEANNLAGEGLATDLTEITERRALARTHWSEQAGEMADPNDPHVLLEECMKIALEGKAFDLFDLCRAQLQAAYALDGSAFREVAAERRKEGPGELRIGLQRAGVGRYRPLRRTR